MSEMFKGLFIIFWLFLVILPLAIWKVIDIILFIFSHIKIV